MDSRTYTNIQKAQTGDKAALETLTKENTPLIRSVAARFRGRGAEDEDLFQIGAIGFIKAIRAFDTARQVELSTYAVPMIMGEIRRFLRDSGLIKISRSLRETAQKASAAMQTLSMQTGKDVSLSALSVYLHIPAEDLVAALEATKLPDSLYRPIGDEDGRLMDTIPLGEDIAEKAADRVTIRRLLDTGDPLEKEVIRHRYFGDKTQMETAKLLGISQVQVSRAEKKAIGRLRLLMTEHSPEKR